ncbi:hypothetical protein ACOMHN_005645 [Nucella lapillus]
MFLYPGSVLQCSCILAQSCNVSYILAQSCNVSCILAQSCNVPVSWLSPAMFLWLSPAMFLYPGSVLQCSSILAQSCNVPISCLSPAMFLYPGSVLQCSCIQVQSCNVPMAQSCNVPGSVLQCSYGSVLQCFCILAQSCNVSCILAQSCNVSCILAQSCNVPISWLSPAMFLYPGSVLQCSCTLAQSCNVPKPIPPEAKDSALTRCPGVLELFGQCYFFGGFLVGPQYCMQRYLNFVHGEYSDPRTRGPPSSHQAALERFLLGVVYIGAFQAIYLFVSDDYLQSVAFQERGLLFKCVVLLVWGKTCLNKYIGSWLLTEGAIIYCGLSYNDVDTSDVPQWDACTNVRIRHLESASTLQHIIQSFNCNTNLWMAKYIFKRLRFLGSKMLSQWLTLFYLALWHGINSGYYVCFFLEFVYMFCERQVRVVCERQIVGTAERVEVLRKLQSRPGAGPVFYVAKKIFSTFLISWALVAFSLLQWGKWKSVYSSMHYLGFVIPLVLIPVCLGLRPLLPSKLAHNGLSAETAPNSRSKAKED